ncbi:MAG TPA: tetratricopeptide repeat protein [Rectinemataceae bacterium]|nr:tetratricopeptide repeat protein [Rectinemataceae bacterium]
MPDTNNEALLAQALEAGAARDYRRAVSLLTILVADDEAPAEALLFLGRSHHALGELGRAIEAFRAYLRAGGDQAKGAFFLGRTLLAGGLHVEAARALRSSAEADSAKASTWALLGAAELKLRRSGAAVDHLERAVNLAPRDTRIYKGYLNALFVRGIRDLLHGDPELAAQTFGFVVANGLDSTAARLWRARALRELGRHAEALAECLAAEALSPGDASLSWLKAGILIDLGRTKEALALAASLGAGRMEGAGPPTDQVSLDMLRAGAAFKRGDWKEAAAASLAALRGRGDLPARARAGMHAMAAESLRRSGNASKALAEALEAVAADQRSPDLRVSLALVLFDLDRHAEALEAIEAARSLGAGDEDCDYLEALCHSRVGGDDERSLAILQDRLHRDSSAGILPDKRLLFAIGECLYRSGRPDLSRGWFEKVLEMDPDHELALLYRISVGESLRDAKLRKTAYRDYLGHYPDNTVLRREFADLLASSGDWKAVASVLEEGLPWAGSSFSQRRMLARAWREIGRWGESAVLYRDLLLEDPEDGELLMALCLCLHHDGRSAFAWALLDKAPEAALTRAGPWVVKGILSEKLDKQEAAFDSFRRAAEIEPHIERPWRELARIYEDKGLYASAQEAREKAAAALPKGEIPRPRKPA